MTEIVVNKLPIETAPPSEIVIVGAGRMWSQAIWNGGRWRHAHDLRELCFKPEWWIDPTPLVGGWINPEMG
jgi:hypothetical protein